MSTDRQARVRQLFAEVVEIDPGRRAGWLAEACRGDADLEQEVRSLLAAYEARGEQVRGALEALPHLSDLAGAAAPDLSVGQRVTHYEITARLGQGGMGVVYKATDTRLDRTVALKFLSPELARDPVATRRFLHEARSASALDHPGICTVHGVDETGDGQPFFVMAFVEGESLRDRITRRPLPVPEALDIGIQVAEALAYAHEHGIVHRDIKPANVMVKPDGRVTVVDFGLAKTADVSLTSTGVRLGTLSCMSPEQVGGELVDHRTDLWALGVLIYEMLTGAPPFRRDRPEAEVAAILSADPEPLTALRSGLPLALDGVVLKLLEKQPGRRYQHADEVAVDLRSVDPRPDRVSTPPGARSGGTRRPLPLAALFGVALASVAVVIWFVTRPDMPASSPVHFAITLPDDQRLSSWFQPLALSPGGGELVYSARAGDQTQLYARALERLTTEPIAGTEGGHDPFFSADGRWIGFFADGRLRKVPVGGGLIQDIGEARQSSVGAAWSPDDMIVFAVGIMSGLMRVSAEGGPVETLTAPDAAAGEIGHYYPQFLPDGRTILFSIWAGEGWRTALLDLETRQWHELFRGGAAARYVPTGHLVYAEMASGDSRPRLLARSFDPSTGVVGAAPVSVLDPPGLAGPNFAVSSGGTLAYIASGSPAWAGLNEGRVVWMDAQGATEPLADLEGYVEIPRLSPDGRRLAYANFSASGAYDVWVRDLDSRQEWRVTRQGVVNNFPVWSPDGTQLVFNSARVPFGLYAKAADGTGDAELLVPRRPPFPQLPGSWSFDGLALAFTEVDGQGRGDIWVYTRATGATALLATDADESTPRFSPTAGLLAYVADVSDVHEVHVRRYPDTGEDLVVSVGGGTAPAWSPDGSHLYYRRGDAMMKVDIIDGDRLAAGRPTLVVEAALIGGSFGYTNYDVASGERFLVVEPRTDVPTTSVNVVLNWFTSLRALMGQ